LAGANLFSRILWAGCAIAAHLPAQAQSGVHAAEERDCGAINQGYLTLVITSSTKAVRKVRLVKGDLVTLTIAAGAGGSVTLPTRTRPLLTGRAGTRRSYAALRSGDFAFRFASEGDAVSFTATCTPAAVRTARIAADMSYFDGLLEEDPGSRIDPEALTSQPTALAKLNQASPPGHAKGEAANSKSGVHWDGTQNGGATADAKPNAEAGPTNIGLKVKVQPAIMVGVLAQFDQGEAALPVTSDRNWLAGPVTSLHLGAGTSLDARAAWGPLEYDAAAKSHGAERRLMDARLTSRQELGAWRFSPSVGLNYTQDRRETGLAAPEAIGLQTSGTGRVDVRPEVAYRVDMDHAMFIEPKVMVGPFWDIGDNAAAGSGASAHVDARLKAETGVTFGTTDGTKLQIGGGVEEGGPNALNVWSGRLRLDVPLK
jgi:hypothetical protein